MLKHINQTVMGMAFLISGPAYGQTAGMLSFQGRLMDSMGAPINGTVDLEFRIYRDPVSTSIMFLRDMDGDGTVEDVIGEDAKEVTGLVVTNGIVSTSFGPVFPSSGDSIILEGRWLDVRVDGTPLSRIEIITSVAVAEHLNEPGSSRDALRIDPSDVGSGSGISSPNIIAGSFLNEVGPGVIGATIGGGGACDTITMPCDNGTEPNQVLADFGTVGGGNGNKAEGEGSTVAGGGINIASGLGATVSGGGDLGGALGNRATGYYSTVGGGSGNEASGSLATVGGGGNDPFVSLSGNTAMGDYSTVGGGRENLAGFMFPGVGNYTTVGGGFSNEATGENATIGGGTSNAAFGSAATVSGGSNNGAWGNRASVPGGDNNDAVGAYSLAAGRHAKANFNGMFVWSDNSGLDFPNPADSNFTPGVNQFLARARGGVVFVTAAGATGLSSAGVKLNAGGGSWSSLSNRNSKANIEPVDGRDVLRRLEGVSISRWNYKSQDESIRHIGPMAQDFHAAFAVGKDERFITSIDADGVALAAIKGLHHTVKEQQAGLYELQQRVVELERAVAELSSLRPDRAFTLVTPTIAIMGVIGWAAIRRSRQGGGSCTRPRP